MASRFKQEREYIQWRDVKCFCSDCYDGPATIDTGEPPRPCVVPVGFVRVPLVMHPGVVSSNGVFERYYTCYHGTDIQKARTVISTTHLLQQGQVLHTGGKIHELEGHHRDGEWLRVRMTESSKFGPKKHKLVPRTSQNQQLYDSGGACEHAPSKLFFTSPSLQYAMVYSPHTDYGGEAVQVCFEMRQDPDSISVLCSTLVHTPSDPLVPHDEMEWFTDRCFPAIVPVAVLVRICPYPSSADMLLERMIFVSIDV
jgi:hypothetical protein